jgi:hypothetical protein
MSFNYIDCVGREIELLFKEWKSYANLHRFVTSKAPIAEGFIWASLAASIVKRFFAHATQQVIVGPEISTRRAAMATSFHLQLLFVALIRHVTVQGGRCAAAVRPAG